MDHAEFGKLGVKLAAGIHAGKADEGAKISERLSAMLLAVEGWTAALPRDSEAVNMRVLKSFFDVVERPEANELPEVAQKEYAEIGRAREAAEKSESGAITERLGRDMALLAKGLSEGDADRFFQVGFDYAWRRYCVEFHIPEAQKAAFGSGDALLDYENIVELYAQARFEKAEQKMGGFKLFIAQSSMAGLRHVLEGAPLAKAQNSMIEGVSSFYLHRAIPCSLVNPEKLEAECARQAVDLIYPPNVYERKPEEGKPILMDHFRMDGEIWRKPPKTPFNNPMVVFFDKAVEAETGFSLFDAVKARQDLSPEIKPLGLESWRAGKPQKPAAEDLGVKPSGL